ncbi:MAG: hypothetical protein JXB47_17290 [Anaerolineae bacterium]|nr:hypothetical protein [Anaerolineae bacterium]
MDETLTPAMLEDLLERCPDALSGDVALPEDVLARYPDARAALDDLKRLVWELETTLKPVYPRPDFVQELKFALVQAPAPGETPGPGWFPRRSLQVAGAVAIGAGLWYIAIRRRNRGEPGASPLVT